MNKIISICVANRKRLPMIVLILAWNFKKEIITKVTKMYKQVGLKPIFVIPIPRVKIINE